MLAADAQKLVKDTLAGIFATESARLENIDRYMQGTHAGPYMPRSATAEYRLLVTRAKSNWLPLVVDAVAQGLYVENYRNITTGSSAASWAIWQENGMDARQIALHRAATTYGHAYTLTLPGTKADGKLSAVIRPKSPRRMIALYDDPAEDEWPQYAMEVGVEYRKGKKVRVVTLYDYEGGVNELVTSIEGGAVKQVKESTTGLNLCPVVRYANMMDLEGRTLGEIEPLIVIQDRINQSIFDLLIAQTFSSFKVRTVSGMVPPILRDADGNPILDAKGQEQPLPINTDPTRFQFAASPDTKFDQLDETPLDPFLASIDMSVRHLAAISQTPPHYLLGQMANLSAEALNAAESGRTRKITERQHTFGEAHEQTLRLAALAAGDTAGAADTSAQVVWADTEARSFSQTVDALGKAAQMLLIPPEGLWPRMPGATKQDLADWARLAKENDTLTKINELVDQGGAKPPAPANDAAA